MSTEHRGWTWVGPKQRHSLKFSHNTFTGGQRLEIDGVVVHEVKWKYKLTGCLHFKLHGLTAELLLSGDGAQLSWPYNLVTQRNPNFGDSCRI
jgi:hypothetical protein